MADNTLYHGDNLDILRRYVAGESIDLVYLDPPFNSNMTACLAMIAPKLVELRRVLQPTGCI